MTKDKFLNEVNNLITHIPTAKDGKKLFSKNSSISSKIGTLLKNNPDYRDMVLNETEISKRSYYSLIKTSDDSQDVGENEAEIKRVALDIDGTLHKKLTILGALHGLTLAGYCKSIIIKEVDKIDMQALITKSLE